MIRKIITNTLSALIVVILLVATLVIFASGYDHIQAFLTERAPNHYSSEIGSIQAQLRELHRIMEATTKAHTLEISDVEQLNKKLNEVSGRFGQLSAESSYKDALMVANERFTSQGLTLATLWVGIVAIAFTIFVALLGFGNFRKAQELKDDLEKGQEEYKKYQVAYQALQAEFDGDRKQLKNQTASTQRFVQTLAESFFSDALLELLRELQNAGVLSPEADETLRAKTKEVESRIFLRHPDFDRVNAAIQVLEGLGSLDAIPDLSELIQDDETPPKTRGQATRAIARISKRFG